MADNPYNKPSRNIYDDYGRDYSYRNRAAISKRQKDEEEKKRKQREKEKADELRKKEEAAKPLNQVGSFIGGLGDFAGEVARETSKRYTGLASGVSEVLGEATGANDAIRRNQAASMQQQEALIKRAKQKIDNPKTSDAEKNRWREVIRKTAQDDSAFQEANTYNQTQQETVDPAKGAANVVGVGIDAISGGSLMSARTGLGFAETGLSIGRSNTGRLIKGVEDLTMGMGKRITRQAGAGAALEGAYSPVRQYAEDKKVDAGQVVKDATFGAVLGGAGGVLDGAMTRGGRKRLANEKARSEAERQATADSADKAADYLDYRTGQEAAQQNGQKLLGSGVDTAKSRLEEIRALKEAQAQGAFENTSFQDALPGNVDQAGRPASAANSAETDAVHARIADETGAVQQQIDQLETEKASIMDSKAYRRGLKDIEMRLQAHEEKIASMPPGAQDYARQAVGEQLQAEADQLHYRWLNQDELTAKLDEEISTLKAQQDEIAQAGMDEVSALEARQAEIRSQRQEQAKNMTADDWRALQREEETLTSQVQEVERLQTLADEGTVPGANELLNPETRPDNFNEDGTLNVEKVKEEFKTRKAAELNENHQKASTDAAITPPVEGQKLTPEERSDALLEEIDNLKGQEARKSFSLWAPFELPTLVLRNVGLEKTANKLDSAVLKFKRANYADVKLIDSHRRGVPDKPEQLFDAVTDNQVYNSLSAKGKAAVDAWRKYAREAADELGLPESARIEDYIHHMFLKDGRAGIAKLADVEKRIDEARKALENADASLTKAQRGQLKANLTRATKARDALFDNNNQPLSRFVKDTGKVNTNILKKRKGAEGYSKEFWKMWESYSMQKNRKVHIEPVSMELEEIANVGLGGDTKDPLVSWLHNYSEQLRGFQSDIDRKFNTATKGYGVGALKKGRNVMSLAKLGFSVNSAINSTSQAINLAPVLGAKAATRGNLEAMGLLARIGKNKLSNTETAMVEEMFRNGLFEGSSHLIPEEALARYGHHFNRAAFSGIMGADRYMRMSAYLGSRHTKEGKALVKKIEDFNAKNPGKENPFEDELQAYQIRMSNKINQNFDQIVAPTAFRSQVARSLLSLVTFVPGQIIRGGEIAGSAAKAGGRIATGKSMKNKQFREDVDKIARLAYLAGGIYAADELIGQITGQDESFPNPFSSQTWSSPAIQLLAGNDYTPGLLGLLPSPQDEVGDYQDRATQFFTEVLPSFTVPGWSQGKRSYTGLEANGLGFASNRDGSAKFFNEGGGIRDLQRVVTGVYSTPEGRRYLDEGMKGYGSTETEAIRTAESPAEKKMLQDYYSADNGLTADLRKRFNIKGGRNGMIDEIKKLEKEGDLNKAQRYRDEWNAMIELAYEPVKQEFDGMIPDDLLQKIERKKLRKKE